VLLAANEIDTFLSVTVAERTMHLGLVCRLLLCK